MSFIVKYLGRKTEDCRMKYSRAREITESLCKDKGAKLAHISVEHQNLPKSPTYNDALKALESFLKPGNNTEEATYHSKVRYRVKRIGRTEQHIFDYKLLFRVKNSTNGSHPVSSARLELSLARHF